MIIEIGNKSLKDMSSEDVRQIVIIEGCCPYIEYNGEKIWSEPVMKDFNNTMFHDTHVLGYSSFRVSDNIESCYFEFYLNFKDFSYHYTRDYESNQNQKSTGNRLGIKSIKYLISKGYDVPLYNVA
jgi:hypothetical protein